MSVLCKYAIAAFFAYFSKVRTSHIFPHKIAFSMAILIFIVSITGTYFYYVLLPRPSGSCQQNGAIHVSGRLWNEMG